MSRLPIRLRLTLVFALAMALVLAALGVFVAVRFDRQLDASLDQRLRLQLDDAAADRTTEGIAQLLAPDGRVLRGPRAPMLPPDVVRIALRHQVAWTGARAGAGDDWRVVARADRGNVVAVGSSVEPNHEAVRHLVAQLLLAMPVALLLASGAAYLLAGAALAPVEAMRRRADDISAHTPGERLPVPPGRDEIARLGSTLNEMLDRIEAAVEHERRFVADASHELRTPLALLKTELDLALRRPRSPEELRDALRSAAEEADRLTLIAEDLLLLARSEEGGGLPLRRGEVAVAELLEDVARRFASRAAEEGRTVVVADVDGLRVDADPQRVEQALGNLVDNALRHGRGTVRLDARPAGTAVELHVVDEGGGFPDAFLGRAFERFSRADEARGRGGTGLGLAIVDLIARAHGGRAGAANTPAGADVWIAVPKR